MDKKVMQLYYDTAADTLYLSVGDPRPAISEELCDDVIVRRDPQTDEIVGLTILSLARFTSLEKSHIVPVEIELHISDSVK